MKQHLTLPQRPEKPRSVGRTHVLDKGTPVAELSARLEDHGQYVDFAKLGWGTALVTENLAKKLQVYGEHDVEVSFGGTLFEIVWRQDRLDEYAAWLAEIGVTSVEVSNGTVEISEDDKCRAIERLAESFTVYSEVGSKDSAAVVSPIKWVAAIQREFEAGASYVILEGRESGTAGLYRQGGEIRMGLIDEILDSGVPSDRLVFEAGLKRHQAWLIDLLGQHVNLANIPLDEVVPLETLRLGLRADTLPTFHG